MPLEDEEPGALKNVSVASGMFIICGWASNSPTYLGPVLESATAPEACLKDTGLARLSLQFPKDKLESGSLPTWPAFDKIKSNGVSKLWKHSSSILARYRLGSSSAVRIQNGRILTVRQAAKCRIYSESDWLQETIGTVGIVLVISYPRSLFSMLVG